MAKAVEDSGVLLEFHFALMPGPTYVGLQIGIQISEYSKSSVLNKVGMKKKKKKPWIREKFGPRKFRSKSCMFRTKDSDPRQLL